MIYRRRVCVGDTDVTGAIYFSQLLRFCLEGFEHYLVSKNFSLKECLLPIVHTSADYVQSARLWDELEIHLRCAAIGETSFTIESEIKDYAKASIVHVVTDLSGKKQKIPAFLKKILLPLN